jgi:exopolysaccharide production protein ExoQ
MDTSKRQPAMLSPTFAVTFALSSLIGVCALFALLAPRLTPALLGVLALSFLAADRLAAPRVGYTRTDFTGPVSIITAAFAAYCLASSLWAANAGQALQSGAQTLLLLICALYLSVAIPRRLTGLPFDESRRYLRAAPIGVALGAAFLVEELLSGHRLMIAMLQAFPGLAGAGRKGLEISGDEIAGMHAFYINQNVAALVLLAGPALAATRLWLSPRIGSIAIALGLALAAAGVFASFSETAKLGLAAAVIVYLAAQRRRDLATKALMAVFAIGLVLAPALGRVPAALGLHQNQSLPVGVRERVVIWDATARAGLQAPLFGIGLQSTRFTKATAVPGHQLPEGRSQLGWHSHNAYLQSWLELGAVGVALLLALGLLLIREAARFSTAVAPFALALTAAALATAATGWGMWQPWLLASLLTAIAFLRIAETEVQIRDGQR